MLNRATVDLEAPNRPRTLRNSQSSHVREPAKQLWLDAWADPVAGVKAFSGCITTCNLCGDGDWRLIVADADKKLKVWKGTQKASEVELQDDPVAVCALLLDNQGPRLPTLAVAAGSHIYMFQNLRPLFRFTLPPADTSLEHAIWQSMNAGQCSAQAGAGRLQELQASGLPLTTRSVQLLSLSDPKEQQAFAATSREEADSNLSFITCMAVIRQAADEPDGVAQLVVGTEDSRVLLLGQGCTTVSSSITLPAAATLMSSAGGLDTGYRVTVAARDGWLYSVRGGALSKTVIQLDSLPVGLVTTNKQIIVGTMSDALHCYSPQGSKQYTLYLPASIMAMQLLTPSSTRATRCVVVALSNGALRVYNDKTLVTEHTSSSPVSGLFVGRYAREDNSLVTVTAAGGLDIKIMPRTANLEVAGAAGSSGPLPEQEVPLDVPKKTRLYVEQTQREREHAVDMHRVFQRDLVKMRLETARALVKVLTDGQGTHAAAANLSMSVSIQGLGPRFRLLISLSNEGEELATDLQVLVQSAAQGMYQIHTPHFVVPCLVPLLQYIFKADLTCLQQDSGSGAVKVIVVGPGHQAALLMTAHVQLPVSEPDD